MYTLHINGHVEATTPNWQDAVLWFIRHELTEDCCEVWKDKEIVLSNATEQGEDNA